MLTVLHIGKRSRLFTNKKLVSSNLLQYYMSSICWNVTWLEGGHTQQQTCHTGIIIMIIIMIMDNFVRADSTRGKRRGFMDYLCRGMPCCRDLLQEREAPFYLSVISWNCNRVVGRCHRITGKLVGCAPNVWKRKMSRNNWQICGMCSKCMKEKEIASGQYSSCESLATSRGVGLKNHRFQCMS